MAPLNKITYFSAAAAAALFLILAIQAPPADARKYTGVNQFCRTASYRNLCTGMVKGATNLHDASVNALQSTLELAKKLQAMAPKKEKLPANTPTKDPRAQKNQVIDICEDNLDSVVSDMEKSLEALEKNDIGTVRSRLSGALRTDCQEAIKDSSENFAFAKYLGVMKKDIDNCFAVVLQS